MRRSGYLSRRNGNVDDVNDAFDDGVDDDEVDESDDDEDDVWGTLPSRRGSLNETDADDD